MSEQLTLSEYRNIAGTLREFQPFYECCGNVMLDTIYVEPLAGRNTLEVNRTCIMECPTCNRQYVSNWD